MADDEGRRIEHDGRTFVFFESGEGPLVVLFHGFPDHPAAWDGIRARLVDAGFRTVAPFLRGYHLDTIVKGRGASRNPATARTCRSTRWRSTPASSTSR